MYTHIQIDFKEFLKLILKKVLAVYNIKLLHKHNNKRVNKKIGLPQISRFLPPPLLKVIDGLLRDTL